MSIQIKADDLVGVKERVKTRPTCVKCGHELIFAAIQCGTLVFSAYLCDCLPQPETLPTLIVQAREWDEQALVIEVAQ